MINIFRFALKNTEVQIIKLGITGNGQCVESKFFKLFHSFESLANVLWKFLHEEVKYLLQCYSFLAKV